MIIGTIKQLSMHECVERMALHMSDQSVSSFIGIYTVHIKYTHVQCMEIP